MSSISKEKIVLFTKTKWHELPRIRHQMARLLKDYGHKVIFFEKCSYNFLRINRRKEEDIELITHSELLHHQLRPFTLLYKMNSIFLKKIISKIIGNEDINLIINFNYDYYFLREIFPHATIVTIINDDFEAHAKFWMGGTITEQVALTCSLSDLVLTVSYPLYDKLTNYNKNTELLFPWAENKYKKPKLNKLRNTVLYFGYINYRLDWKVLFKLADCGIKLRLVGPVDRNVTGYIKELNRYKNVSIEPPTDINELYIDDVYCSIVPYDLKYKSVRACTVPNKFYNLLGLGLPIVIADLERLINASEKVVRKCVTIDDYLSSITYFKREFYNVQKDIEKFLEGNYSESRYAYLLNLINKIRLKNR